MKNNLTADRHKQRKSRWTGLTPFFRRIDWLAFWVVFALSLGIYMYTLAPTVTLEDSGELAVASDYLGVPHPPGYPIWTLATWFFQWVFQHRTYLGNPNPAWSVGLASAFFGALSCGLLALLVSRSGSDMLAGMKRETRALGRRTENMICWTAAVTAGMLLALSPVLWSQSVIVEVYSLNAFFLMTIMALAYRWMQRPQETVLLYIAAFVFGMGLTNHHTLLFIVFGLMTALWCKDRRLFRDALAALSVALSVFIFWQSFQGAGARGPQYGTRIIAGIMLLAPVGLYLIEKRLLTEWKRLLIIGALVGLGLSFYLYMPIASEQNPPMNWGYARTWQGFVHAVSRGQYERISPLGNLLHAITHPLYFLRLLNAFITCPTGYVSVVAQFTWPIAMLAAVPLLFLRRTASGSRNWLLVSLVTFLSLTVVFIVFQYPSMDIQTMFIGRVQYIQAHAVFALWIGYGILLGLAFLTTRWGGRKTATAASAALMLLPLALVHRNAYNDDFIKIVGACEQRGHNFGWMFGHWSLQGRDAILAEISAEESKQYPNPDYPPPMGANAVFFGGTDPGRFVPTYMIYSARVREDIHLITQNALADNTYMSVMRDLYGDQIWIPALHDSNRAFQEYVHNVRTGRVPAGAEVTITDGRVSVQGVQGVMQINGILARMIFEHNKERHPFYVEESYVIPWMYPYLQPHGLIMKISKEPLPELPAETIRNDREFWTWLCDKLLADRKFLRDVVARKSFSKLRSAIAGLYAARELFDEAEFAFQQSIALYPLSPEANFRLADLHMRQKEYDEAAGVIESFRERDPENENVEQFLENIRQTTTNQQRRREIEMRLQSGGTSYDEIFELLNIYRALNKPRDFEQLVRQIINAPEIAPQALVQTANLCVGSGRPELAELALQQYVQQAPRDANAWLDLAALRIMLRRPEDALKAAARAVETGGEAARDILRRDRRFEPIRRHPAFRQMVSPNRERKPPQLPLPGL